MLEMSWLHSLEPTCPYTVGVNVDASVLGWTYCCQRQHNMPGDPTEDSPRDKKWIPKVFSGQKTNSVLLHIFKQFYLIAAVFCSLWSTSPTLLILSSSVILCCTYILFQESQQCVVIVDLPSYVPYWLCVSWRLHTCFLDRCNLCPL